MTSSALALRRGGIATPFRKCVRRRLLRNPLVPPLGCWFPCHCPSPEIRAGLRGGETKVFGGPARGRFRFDQGKSAGRSFKAAHLRKVTESDAPPPTPGNRTAVNGKK